MKIFDKKSSISMCSICIFSVTFLQANIFSSNGKDPRFYADFEDQQKLQIASVGVVKNLHDIWVVNRVTGRKMLGRGSATAFMISPCFALTSHHVVFGDNVSPSKSDDYSVSISFHTNSSEITEIATPVKWGNIVKYPGDDWAILKVQNCPGRMLGWMKLSFAGPDTVVGQKVSTAGYPYDRGSEKISVQPACSIMNYNPALDLYLHDCAARPGASGSPIYITKDGFAEVVAISSSEIRAVSGVMMNYDSNHANHASTMSMLLRYPEISSVIQKDSDANAVLNSVK